ncbi:MAG: electron transport complex subunit E, partial [Clostridiales bacterium]|nr:electron transport complex subunit E [Clostridiales bacterium]
SKQTFLPSILDGLSMGTGFTLALLLMGTIREILGCGTFFDMKLPLFGDVFEPMMFFMLPPGGFFVFGICICFVQIIMKKQEKHASGKSSTPCGVAGDSSDCLSCGGCSLCKGKEE